MSNGYNLPAHGRRARTTPAFIRDRNRITLQFTSEEKRALEWLSRCPDSASLPRPFNALRRAPVRQIAKTISAKQLSRLVEIHTRRDTED